MNVIGALPLYRPEALPVQQFQSVLRVLACTDIAFSGATLFKKMHLS